MRGNLWLARQLALGHLGADTAVACLMLDDSPFPLEEKIRLAEQILQRAPDLAAAHLQLGKNLDQAGRSKEAGSAYRRGLECVQDLDTKSRLLVALGVLVDGPEKASLLREALAPGGNLVAAAMAKLALKAAAQGGVE